MNIVGNSTTDKLIQLYTSSVGNYDFNKLSFEYTATGDNMLTLSIYGSEAYAAGCYLQGSLRLNLYQFQHTTTIQ